MSPASPGCATSVVSTARQRRSRTTTWLTAQSLNVHYLAATNDLPQAEARMQRLAATAPANQGLQIDYAALLQERGLPRAAERQLKAAESLEPASLQLERQQA